MTGFSQRVRELITERADGCCERCGNRTWDMQVHHRRPRGAGGSRRPETNQAANGMLLDAACHIWVESNRTAALSDGLLVRQSDTPATVPVFRRGVYVWLGDDGSITPVSVANQDKKCGQGDGNDVSQGAESSSGAASLPDSHDHASSLYTGQAR